MHTLAGLDHVCPLLRFWCAERPPPRRTEPQFRADVDRARQKLQAFHDACLTNTPACYKTQSEKLQAVCELVSSGAVDLSATVRTCSNSLRHDFPNMFMVRFRTPTQGVTTTKRPQTVMQQRYRSERSAKKLLARRVHQNDGRTALVQQPRPRTGPMMMARRMAPAKWSWLCFASAGLRRSNF